MSQYFGNDIRICLRYALAMRNLTEGQFAKMTNISYSSIIRYTSGATCPKNDTIQRLAGCLGLKPYHLLGHPNPDDPTDSIGFRMRNARRNAGMTVPELAAKTEATAYEIDRCENNHELIAYRHFEQAANILGVSVPYLLFGQ